MTTITTAARTRPPACDEPEFAALLAGAVADEAPRVFAIVEEFGDRHDARIAAWGMAFPEHAELVGIYRPLRMTLTAPESALPLFTRANTQARLIWAAPETPDEI
ncbi:hypothetical protein [Actinokineospora terrae]|uniref:Uncharacterized protein n=1 Tax=Actinokineospora terrae TaxID=155974 RepID=A0A1H9NQY4_9PSEU|nr:hypothetical protein [Actinokineospora terrae]SER38338.1 hypothetical protein SAMN04487818_10387 [Actinokineospora terrae]